MELMLQRWSRWVLAAWLCAGAGETGAQMGWAPARLLADTQRHIKEPRLYPSSEGGFHAIYRHQNNEIRLPAEVVYRRYLNQSLQPAVPIASLRYLWGGDVAEDGAGNVHLVWEHWDDADEQIWWAKSSDGGRTFPVRQAITAYPHGANDNDNRYDGVNWGGNTALPQYTGDIVMHNGARSVRLWTKRRAHLFTAGCGRLAFNLEVSALKVAPRLTATRTAGVIQLHWKDEADHFRLQSAPALETGSAWNDVNRPVVKSNVWRSVSYPSGAPAIYFRLAK